MRRGLVARRRLRHDRRAYRLNLTPAGRQDAGLAQRLRAPARAQCSTASSAVRERKRFIAVLKRIAAEIE